MCDLGQSLFIRHARLCIKGIFVHSQMLDSFTQCLDLAESKRGRTALEKVALFGEFLEVGLLTRRRRRILSGSVGVVLTLGQSLLVGFLLLDRRIERGVGVWRKRLPCRRRGM